MKTVNVLVKKGALRTQPSFIGQVIADVGYGEAVQVVEQANGWTRVKVIRNGHMGWMHDSALSDKAMSLKSGGLNAGQSATGDELALAGKGFNKQVEQQFRSRNPGVDFSWVNKMEAFTISDRQVQIFLQEGQVLPGGGGQS
ncbi:MAG: SH3 domain-containing protein [Desulfamplus sp.]|nr:SH3 domain-containing protein [Desulfamplus sp.]